MYGLQVDCNVCEDCLQGVLNDVSEVDDVSMEDHNDVNAVDATEASPLISCEKSAVQTHFLIASVSGLGDAELPQGAMNKTTSRA